MKKFILLGLLAAAVIAGITGYRMWNKPHQNMGLGEFKILTTRNFPLARPPNRN